MPASVTTTCTSVHLANDLTLTVRDFTDTESPFVAIGTDDVTLFIHNRDQVTALLNALRDADEMLAIREAKVMAETPEDHLHARMA